MDPLPLDGDYPNWNEKMNFRYREWLASQTKKLDNKRKRLKFLDYFLEVNSTSKTVGRRKNKKRKETKRKNSQRPKKTRKKKKSNGSKEERTTRKSTPRKRKRKVVNYSIDAKYFELEKCIETLNSKENLEVTPKKKKKKKIKTIDDYEDEISDDRERKKRKLSNEGDIMGDLKIMAEKDNEIERLKRKNEELLKQVEELKKEKIENKPIESESNEATNKNSMMSCCYVVVLNNYLMENGDYNSIKNDKTILGRYINYAHASEQFKIMKKSILMEYGETNLLVKKNSMNTFDATFVGNEKAGVVLTIEFVD